MSTMTSLWTTITRSPITWLVCACVFALAGVMLARPIRTDLLYVVPTAAATWYVGRRLGIGIALGLSVVRPLAAILGVWSVARPFSDTLANAALGGLTLAFAIIAVSQIKARMAAQAEVRALRGLLPICSYCKSIRNDSDSWERLETYISEHSEAQFTHGICPKCMEKHFDTNDSTPPAVPPRVS